MDNRSDNFYKMTSVSVKSELYSLDEKHFKKKKTKALKVIVNKL